MSYWRTQNCGDVRVRIMKYAPGFRTGTVKLARVLIQ
jgi:hypothetical protein